MAVLKNYIPEIHDIYIYDQPASLHRPSGTKVDGIPIGYNPNCYAFSADFTDHPLDLTGLAVLPRRFNNAITRAGMYDQFEDRWDEEFASEYGNINFYNSGLWAAMLISPKHVIACQHYLSAVPSQLGGIITFMNKDGEKFETGVSRYIATDRPGGFNLSGDCAILELDEEVPADAGITIYNKVPITPRIGAFGGRKNGYRGFPRNIQMFRKTPNGALYSEESVGFSDRDGQADPDCPECGKHVSNNLVRFNI
jgi:hypothetical protein